VTTDSIRQLVEPALTSAGLELWDVEVARDVLRIMVDRPGGIDLDALSVASDVLSPLLDEHPEATPLGSYQLEVSSPGVERTLRTPDQYQRFVGTAVTVKTSEPMAGSRRHKGTLVAAGDEGIAVQPEDARGGPPLELRYDQIDRARTVLVWGPPPRPSAKAGSRRASSSPTQPKDAGL
jgi:ribosome maturation factor RimP